MSTLVWQPLHHHLRSSIEQGDGVLHLIAPFMQCEPLQQMIDSWPNNDSIKVITRWRAADVVSGVSDISIYPYLKQKGIPLFIHNNIHLKLYIYASNKAFHTSGNVTNTALGYIDNCNVEVGSCVSLSTEDWMHIYSLIEASTIVTDEIYEIYQNYITENANKEAPLPPLTLPENNSDKDFSFNRLPATKTPQDLWNYYSSSDKTCFSAEEIRKYNHDLWLYGFGNLPQSKSPLDRTLFHAHLKKNFQAEPFIQAIVKMIQEKQSCPFGAVSSWIHNACRDVPLPYRREIKENTAILYDWLSFYYDEITWDIPGGRSQVIYWKSN